MSSGNVSSFSGASAFQLSFFSMCVKNILPALFFSLRKKEYRKSGCCSPEAEKHLSLRKMFQIETNETNSTDQNQPYCAGNYFLPLCRWWEECLKIVKREKKTFRRPTSGLSGLSEKYGMRGTNWVFAAAYKHTSLWAFKQASSTVSCSRQSLICLRNKHMHYSIQWTLPLSKLLWTFKSTDIDRGGRSAFEARLRRSVYNSGTQVCAARKCHSLSN